MAKYNIAILTSFFEIGPFQKGMGYRFWEFAQTLADCGLNVALITPAPSQFSHPGLEILARNSLGSNRLSGISDIFVFCLHEDESLISKLYQKDKFLIYDSVLTPVEGLDFQKTLDLKDKRDKNKFFETLVRKHKLFNRISTYYLTGTKEEKLLKIGELLTNNQVNPENYNTLPRQIAVLPVCGFNKHSIQIKLAKKTDNLVLWNGGLWNHYNHTPLIDSVVELRRKDYKVKLKWSLKCQNP